MTSEPDPFDELVLDENFIADGPKEAAADERIEKAARIARSTGESAVERDLLPALTEARAGGASGEVPIGAVVLDASGFRELPHKNKFGQEYGTAGY